MASTLAAAAHKPILAERFKSKVCKNFEEQGNCPYEDRCMFAHGAHELRSKEMNLADNLVTEEAIKAFQKARSIAARSAQKKRERDAVRGMKDSSESPRSDAGAAAAAAVVAPLTPLLLNERQETTDSVTPTHTPTHTPRRTYIFEYDPAKYVSPLAAAMLCRPKVVDSCHCDQCRATGADCHDAGAQKADAILLA
jgi:hypothetical protein